MPPLGLASSLGLAAPRSATSSGSPHASGGAVTRQDDLLGWWKFDEESGTTAVDSISGIAGRSLTLYNGGTPPPPTFVPGKHNNAVDFDGSDDYAESTVGPTDANDCTISYWVNCDVSASLKGNVSSYRYYTTGYNGAFSIRWNGGNVKIIMSNGTSIIQPAWTASMSTGAWHLIGVVLDTSASEVSVWVDGVDLGAVATGSRTFSDMSNGLVVGAFRQGCTLYNYFNGKIDDLRIYNAALEDEDMEAIWGSGDGDWG